MRMRMALLRARRVCSPSWRSVLTAAVGSFADGGGVFERALLDWTVHPADGAGRQPSWRWRWTEAQNGAGRSRASRIALANIACADAYNRSSTIFDGRDPGETLGFNADLRRLSRDQRGVSGRASDSPKPALASRKRMKTRRGEKVVQIQSPDNRSRLAARSRECLKRRYLRDEADASKSPCRPDTLLGDEDERLASCSRPNVDTRS